MASAIRRLFQWKTLAFALGIGSLLAAIVYATLAVFFPDIFDGVNRIAHRQIVAVQDYYYDRRTSESEFALEDPVERASLPLYRTIPALAAEKRTPHIAQPEANYQTWHRSTGGAAALRYSSLDEVSPENVAQLDVAWTYEDQENGNVQATPIFAADRLIFPTARNSIIAIDPGTGEPQWEAKAYGPEPAKRGLIFSESHNAVFFASGANLHAIAVDTGEPTSILDGGKVRLSGVAKVAPAICGDTVVSANTGENPALQAFDIDTGDLLWSTELIPDDLPTGTGGRPSKQAGANPWGGFSVDQARCIAFVSTGNPGPVLVGVERPGPNPGSSSVIAIDIATGETLWRFQEIAHDLWDLDIPAASVLTSITLDGQKIDVVATPTKQGNMLLLDRLSGQPIFDWRLRRAPTSTVPGERTATYQPDPILPVPFARQVFSQDEVTDIGEENRASVLAQLSNSLFGFFTPPSPNQDLVFYGLHGGAEWPGAAADPSDGSVFIAANNVPSILGLVPEQKVMLDSTHLGRTVYEQNCASCHGSELGGGVGPNIQDAGYRMSDEALTSIILKGQQAMPAVHLDDQQLQQVLGYLSSGTATGSKFPRYRRAEYRRLYDVEGFPGSKPPWGTLSRINLATGKIDWQIPFGRHLALEQRGIDGTGTENFGGLLTTASGLLFASGTKDKRIYAFDSANGTELWSHQLPYIGSAPPMTYSYNGEQYVVIPATGGGTLAIYDDRVETGNAFIAFKLP
ncbi:PQQ-binding-like beta-propeller repeat protein [Pontixanthobacter aestiaquae]|uniref:PQQ-binding-like beta-propeller repeat protein n=1 Tax=Pontixanthobacter aestiaquae TaxID=1509367 RepID=A0A844Z6B0_9SPHN|nr:PQQ-binding-like beta-propeller repeat protein [Pontixanthobacter aestiaquae]MDN3645655.1 PQQ-binding-like beta-propeller repeat protein [Pontixanthobacter aestiaquae]MXO83348.1 PQQ-binding-like beta-propeller repeat protein [Pontixanthobacter aestiaquae]